MGLTAPAIPNYSCKIFLVANIQYVALQCIGCTMGGDFFFFCLDFNVTQDRYHHATFYTHTGETNGNTISCDYMIKSDSNHYNYSLLQF